MKKWVVLVATHVLLGICVDLSEGQENVLGHIPEYLIDCYRQDQFNNRKDVFPMTVATLVALIRKIEQYPGANMDIRLLSTTLLHRFRMDGIERNPDISGSDGITPYRPSGRQFNKHKILFSQLLPGSVHSFPNDSLSLPEKCALHRMLSSSVDVWERGDEESTCSTIGPRPPPNSPSGSNSIRRRKQKLVSGAQISACPIEGGVVLTDWGTVNAGALIAGIAAGLQRQQVSITEIFTDLAGHGGTDDRFQRYLMMSDADDKLVDNLWATTLAGDLAEVAVWQGPRLLDAAQPLIIGPDGHWNDTLLPRSFYFDEPQFEFWELTDAESRGGADGLILGNRIAEWRDSLGSVKLSQILEMYYSDRGVNFDREIRACRRRENLRDVVTPVQLLAQTCNFARVLSYEMGNVHIEDETLLGFCEKAVTAAISHEESLNHGLSCGMIFKKHPQVHLNVILDGTWQPYLAIQMLTRLAEEADVSFFGSSLSVINGKTGQLMLNRTQDPTEIITELDMKANDWPTGLNLPDSLSKTRSMVSTGLAEERRENLIGGSANIVVVFAFTAPMSDNDFDRSKEEIAAFKESVPELRIMYLTSETNKVRFEGLLTPDEFAQDEVLVASEDCASTVVPLIVSRLSNVPMRIAAKNCEQPEGLPVQFEDYVTPEETNRYRVHPQYFGTTKIKLTVRGSGYGDLDVCLSRDVEDTFTSNCTQEVKSNEQIEFDIVNPCGTTGDQCKPVFLFITGKNSLTKCAEDDCRFPHQIRFKILHDGLYCVVDVDSGLLSSATFTTYLTGLFYLSQILPLAISFILFS